jgi:deoxyribose-phosphate aldolase
MSDFDLGRINQLIDISAVRTDVTMSELQSMADLAMHYRFFCAYTMPCFTSDLARMLAQAKDIHLGGVVGFPSGADCTHIKVITARDMLATGCSELDMVINIGALKSGRHAYVAAEIQAVVQAAEGKPVKAIIEVAYLSRDEIQQACEIALTAGADYIKTGTGWANQPTTIEDVRLIKSTIGDTGKIKVAGGIRSLDVMLEMIDAGCSRFGVGYKSAMQIMRDVDDRLGRTPYKSQTGPVDNREAV